MAVEIDALLCRKETLYPGDALFLPNHIVHLARAIEEGMSAHIAFGFVDTITLWVL